MCTWTLGVMLLRTWASHSPAPAEQNCSTSWAGLMNLSPKSSNFSSCGCYSLPPGKSVKLSAKRQHKLFGTKECFSTPVSGYTHLPPSSYAGRWKTDARYSAAFCAPVSKERKLGSTRQERHSNFQQVPGLRPYLLYNLDIATKVIRASKLETQESFNMNTTSVFHYL